MSFATGYLGDPRGTSSGEKFGSTNIILSARTFEDGLTVGRFAKLDSGSLDNMDASATPVIAGVVLRKASNPIESGSTIDADLFDHVEYLRQGLVTVDVIAGQTPSQFGAVFAHNVAGADIGKASTADDANTEPTNAEFVEEVATNVWLVRLK